MQKTEPLEYGNIYHIYNRGINSCNLFEQNSNYEYFLELNENYISPIAETAAWVLMKNHFHFLVRIKNEKELCPINSINFIPEAILPKPHQHFSNFFNAYSKAFNKRFSRHGGLFERPFKRKLITNAEYYNQVLFYIHNNPVHHGFVENQVDYHWSSFLTNNSDTKIKLQTYQINQWFNSYPDGEQEIVPKMDLDEIDEWLGI
jgi:REP element-mobilizing transposase RayT